MILARKALGPEERVVWAEGGLTKWGSRVGSPGALSRALPHLLSLTVGFTKSSVLSGQAQCIAALLRDLG